MNSLPRTSPASSPDGAVIDRVDRGGVGEDGDDGLGFARELGRRGGDRRRPHPPAASVLSAERFHTRDLVPDLHQPLRDGGAHLADARRCRCASCELLPLPVVGSRRDDKGLCARPRKPLARAPMRRWNLNAARNPCVASAANAMGNGDWEWRRRTVGVVGLGIMGGAFARTSSPPAGAWSATTSIRPAAAPWRAPGSRSPPDAKTLAAEAPTIITSLPKPSALDATVDGDRRRRSVGPRVIVEASTFTIDDKLEAERALRKAGHVMLDCPVSGTGSQAKVKDLVIYASGDSKAIRKLQPLFAGFCARGARPRRLRQRQPHEIRREPPGRHQQRRRAPRRWCSASSPGSIRRPCSRW